MLPSALSALAILLWPTPSLAHTTQQAFVLLLPTGIYTAAGVAVVALTALILIALPPEATRRLLTAGSVRLPDWSGHLPMIGPTISLAALLLLLALIVIGLAGPRDPLANPLPLVIWTLFWIGLVTLQGLLGDLWRWLNPWTGLIRFFRTLARIPPLLTLPAWLGHWPGVLIFLSFAQFYLADLAPDDPARLGSVVLLHTLITLAAMTLFGAGPWLRRGEAFTMLLRLYAALSPFRCRPKKIEIGFPGHRLLDLPRPSLSLAIFMLVLLGTGSFDGLNETFWWLAWLGINPLAFPGRSAVVWPTTIGLLAANLALITIYAGMIWLGLRLAAEPGQEFKKTFCALAPSILPIAFGYHVAHFLTAFLVNGQYALAALSDPLANGSDLLGLGTFYVTTGFFNSQESVRLIWWTQAGAIVVGHAIAVVIAHAIALRLFGTSKRATLMLLPLTLFMIAYTFFGLWLLAAPRGA